MSCVNVNVPVIDCNAAPDREVIAASAEPVPVLLLMIDKSPSIEVIPPRLTVCMFCEMTTLPETCEQAVSAVRSDCELMAKEDAVHAEFDEVAEAEDNVVVL